MALTESDVARILKLIDESQCDELRVESMDLNLYVRRTGSAVPAPALAEPPAAPAAPTEVCIAEGCVVVRAPMVGIFCFAASPGAVPFVQIGDRVEPESTVCLLKVIRLLNSVKAGARGTVREILADDGAPVEFGQPLIVIELSG